jgi:hypothetical protein
MRRFKQGHGYSSNIRLPFASGTGFRYCHHMMLFGIIGELALFAWFLWEIKREMDEPL